MVTFPGLHSHMFLCTYIDSAGMFWRVLEGEFGRS